MNNTNFIENQNKIKLLFNRKQLSRKGSNVITLQSLEPYIEGGKNDIHYGSKPYNPDKASGVSQEGMK
jgi:hypothetical protein